MTAIEFGWVGTSLFWRRSFNFDAKKPIHPSIQLSILPSIHPSDLCFLLHTLPPVSSAVHTPLYTVQSLLDNGTAVLRRTAHHQSPNANPHCERDDPSDAPPSTVRPHYLLPLGDLFLLLSSLCNSLLRVPLPTVPSTYGSFEPAEPILNPPLGRRRPPNVQDQPHRPGAGARPRPPGGGVDPGRSHQRHRRAQHQPRELARARLQRPLDDIWHDRVSLLG